MATWKKIKSAAAATGTAAAETESTSTDELLSDLSTENSLFEYGKNGEIIIVYRDSRILQVWDWKAPSEQTRTESETLYLNFQTKIEVMPSKNQLSIITFKLLDLPVNDPNLIAVVLLVKTQTETTVKYSLITKKINFSSSFHNSQAVELSPVFQNLTDFSLKASKKFVVVANNEGFIYIYRYNVADFKLTPANADFSLPSIRKSSTQPVISRHHLQSVGDGDILLQTSCNQDNCPIFDIEDNWLVYSPTKFEYKHLKAISSSAPSVSANPMAQDPVITLPLNNETVSTHSNLYTPVKLPASGPLLNKLLSTISNTALDGLFRLSEISSSKVKSYMNSKSKETYKAPTINSISKSLGKLLYSTASTTATTLENSTRSLKPNNNQIIKVIDLSNDKVLGVFKPLGGVSNVSLSPYDLHLVHSNYRGDTLFMWDLYRLPSEVSLIGKFTRGKTSAIIEEIFWFNNNYGDQINSSSSGNSNNEPSIKGMNSGFGCITKSTGSVHWFNINYLSGNMNNNFPNSLNKEKVRRNLQSSQFLDSWILSSLKARRFVALPELCNSIAPTASFGDSDPGCVANRLAINQLAIIDSDNQLKLISTLNGRHLYKYELPIAPVAESFIPFNSRRAEAKVEDSKDRVNPLSQAEIETSVPFLNLINNKNIEFAVFSFEGEEGDRNNFFHCFKEFGNDVPEKVIKFENGNHRSNKIIFDLKKDEDVKPEDRLALLDGLYIDQGEGSIEAQSSPVVDDQ